MERSQIYKPTARRTMQGKLRGGGSEVDGRKRQRPKRAALAVRDGRISRGKKQRTATVADEGGGGQVLFGAAACPARPMPASQILSRARAGLGWASLVWEGAIPHARPAARYRDPGGIRIRGDDGWTASQGDEAMQAMAAKDKPEAALGNDATVGASVERGAPTRAAVAGQRATVRLSEVECWLAIHPRSS